jgi:transcriptional regulator with XRE-family HTH domain
MNLQYQLELYLKEYGITASQLSRLTEVPKQTLSNWLGGEKPRDIRQVKIISDYFGTTVDHLCFGQGLVLEKPNLH